MDGDFVYTDEINDNIYSEYMDNDQQEQKKKKKKKKKKEKKPRIKKERKKIEISKKTLIIIASILGGVLLFFVLVLFVFNKETRIVLNNEKVTVKVGQTINLKVTIVNNKDGIITWTSENNQIVSVDNNGRVTGISDGNTTISVTYTDKNKNAYTDTCMVTVIK